MFKRKLEALNFHHPKSFDANDEKEFRTLIVWLEDQKIRHYKVDDRAALRDVDATQWVDGFNRYLRDLNCPIEFRKRMSVLDWLLGYAIRLDYGDSVDKYQEVVQAAQKAQQADQPTTEQAVLDPASAEFKAGVECLAKLLNLPPHTDPVYLFRAVRRLIEDRLSTRSMQESATNPSKKEEVFALAKTELGFDTGDIALNEGAKILRLLHISELRALQTNINQIIVAVQALTANPKTDQRLGKVGR